MDAHGFPCILRAMAKKRARDLPDARGELSRVVPAGDRAPPTSPRTSPVRGCMVIKPWGYAIWENIQRVLDRMFKATGHQNAYFPLFIPMSFLEKEAEHVEGFAKECAVVTHHRLEPGKDGKLVPAGELEEPLIVRPTSETIIGAMFAKWIESIATCRCSSISGRTSCAGRCARACSCARRSSSGRRATPRTRPRPRRVEETRMMLDVVRRLRRDYMAMPVIRGEKTAGERFPGAVATYCIEAMMQDRKALQAGTSHFLGQNFAKASGHQFPERSRRAGVRVDHLVGRVDALDRRPHHDARRRRRADLPPRLAPAHVVILPITAKAEDPQQVIEYCKQAARRAARAALRRRARRGRGRRARHARRRQELEWVKKGVPLRLEVGPRDMAQDAVFMARRDNRAHRKQSIAARRVRRRLAALLDEIQDGLLARARAHQRSSTRARSTARTSSTRSSRPSPAAARTATRRRKSTAASRSRTVRRTRRSRPRSRTTSASRCAAFRSRTAAAPAPARSAASHPQPRRLGQGVLGRPAYAVRDHRKAGRREHLFALVRIPSVFRSDKINFSVFLFLLAPMASLTTEYRTLIRLSWPAALTQIGLMLTSVIDTLMLARVSVDALAGSALATMWQWCFLSIGVGAVVGIDPLISQAHGRGDGPGAALAFQRALVIALLISVPVCIATACTGIGLRLLGEPPAVADLAQRYNLLKLPTVPCFLVFTAQRQYLQGRGMLAPATWVAVFATAINAVLGWALIFGHLGMPALGLRGSAIADTLATAALVLMLTPAMRALGVHSGALRALRSRVVFPERPVSQALRLGLPVGMQIVARGVRRFRSLRSWPVGSTYPRSARTKSCSTWRRCRSWCRSAFRSVRRRASAT